MTLDELKAEISDCIESEQEKQSKFNDDKSRKDRIKTMAEEKVLVFKYAEPLGYKKSTG